MTDNVAISVLMPVHNGAEFLRQAIDSILNQTYADFEFIIIDDGSTDASNAIIKSYKDSRIKLVAFENNEGLIKCLNYGIAIAKGDCIIRMDADDISEPNRFEIQKKFMDDHPSLLLSGTSALRFDTAGNEVEWKYPSSYEGIKLRLLWGTAAIHPTWIINKKHFLSSGFLYGNAEHAEDYDLLTRLVMSNEVRNIPQKLLRYREHENQISIARKNSQVEAARAIAINYIEKALDMSFSDLEKKTFTKVSNYKFELSLLELESVKVLFCKMLSKNRDLHFFENSKFLETLSKRWFFACYFSSHNGFSVLNLYFRNKELFEKPIWSFRNLKFIMKCLLRKNKHTHVFEYFRRYKHFYS